MWSKLYARALEEMIERQATAKSHAGSMNLAFLRGEGSALDPAAAAHVRRMLRKVQWVISRPT